MVRSFNLKSNLSKMLTNFSKILETKHRIFYVKRSLKKLIFIKQEVMAGFYSLGRLQNFVDYSAGLDIFWDY